MSEIHAGNSQRLPRTSSSEEPTGPLVIAHEDTPRRAEGGWNCLPLELLNKR